MSVFWFSIFDRTIRTRCDAEDLETLLLGVYGNLLLHDNDIPVTPDLDYTINYSNETVPQICMHRHGQAPEYIARDDDGKFLYLFEKDMTIELERQRYDLYFLHAAALEYKGLQHLLVAESGGGKSTTSWAMLHHGFRYASDELAPVDLDTMQVLAYPHALCVKQEPPMPYQLPEQTIYTTRTMHVPVNALPAEVVSDILPLGSIIFVNYSPHTESPSIQPVSAAQAGARVYANGLNQLAHPGDGLDAALQIAQHCNCYALESANLKATCQLVKDTLDKDMGMNP